MKETLRRDHIRGRGKKKSARWELKPGDPNLVSSKTASSEGVASLAEHSSEERGQIVANRLTEHDTDGMHKGALTRGLHTSRARVSFDQSMAWMRRLYCAGNKLFATKLQVCAQGENFRLTMEVGDRSHEDIPRSYPQS